MLFTLKLANETENYSSENSEFIKKKVKASADSESSSNLVTKVKDGRDLKLVGLKL